MRLSKQFFALPTSIILLIPSLAEFPRAQEDSAHVNTLLWRYNFRPHARLWPEDPPSTRRDVEDIERHTKLGRSPVGILKMSDDPGEKFYMGYWIYGEEFEEQRSSLDEDDSSAVNASMVRAYGAPFYMHSKSIQYPDRIELEGGPRESRSRESRRDAVDALSLRRRQGFTCPSGTSSCSSISYPNICCPEGETCFSIRETGLGPVGCCPSGSKCGGSVNTCPSPNTACPTGQDDEYVGGGCCIPGYICSGIGCAVDPNFVVTVVSTDVVVHTSLSSTATPMVVSSITSTKETSICTALQTTLPCFSGFHACPVNLGGGCCSIDLSCGSNSLCHSASSSSTEPSSSSKSSSPSATELAGIRPASGDSSSTTQQGTSCPTGFYHCSAVHGGNCCRTDRNCDTFSCPATSSTTIIDGVVTVAVPIGSAATVATPSGNCPGGWSSCAPSVGGNCCPSGWECGTASCLSVEASATRNRQKASPNQESRVEPCAVAVGLTSLMVWLLGC